MAIELLNSATVTQTNENFKRVQGAIGGVLPTVTAEDEGKVLTVDDEGEWVAGSGGGGTGGGVLVVHITENDGVHTTDKTAGEIKAALEVGTPVCVPYTVEDSGATAWYCDFIGTSAASPFVYYDGEYQLIDAPYAQTTLTASSLNDYLTAIK